MNKRKKSFSAIKGLLIIVIVALIGFVGWYVWHSKNSVNKSWSATSTSTTTPVSSTSTKLQKQEKQSTTYTDSMTGYSFEYPKGWTLSVKKESGYIGGKLTYFNIVTVKSPDYKDNGVTEGPGLEITSGGIFTVQSTPPQFDSSQPICQDAQKCFTVDGQKAAQYIYNPGPEGGYWISTVFVKSNNEYDVNYSYAKDGQNKYISAYNDLLASFKTNI